MWEKDCVSCKRSSVQFHVRAPSQSFEIPGRRFQHINVDMDGPVPRSQGHSSPVQDLFTIVNRFNRWSGALHLVDTSTISCARALIRHCFSRFGLQTHLLGQRCAVHFTALDSNI